MLLNLGLQTCGVEEFLPNMFWTLVSRKVKDNGSLKALSVCHRLLYLTKNSINETKTKKLLFETIHSFDNENVVCKLYRLNCTHLKIYDVIRCSNYKTISYREQLRNDQWSQMYIDALTYFISLMSVHFWQYIRNFLWSYWPLNKLHTHERWPTPKTRTVELFMRSFAQALL